jgi:hypothetical protein
MKNYERAAQFIQVLANVAVVIGIIFAVVQLHETRRIESIRLAVEATSPTRSPEFLVAYGKLVDAFAFDADMLNTDSLRGDLSLVMSVYDNIATLYLHDLADREIIEALVHDAMSHLVPILKVKKWPTESRRNFDGALARMSAGQTNRNIHNKQEERHK